MTLPLNTSTKALLWVGLGLLSVASPALATPLPQIPTLQVVDWGPHHVRLLYEADLRAARAMLNAAKEIAPGSEGHRQAATAAVVRDLARGGLVGIPLVGQPRMELVEARETGRFHLGPDAAVAAQWRLDGPAVLGEIGYLRDQRVVQVSFGPRLEVDGSVVAYDRVVVDVRFEGDVSPGGAGGPGPRERFAEALYAAAVVNGEQARGWRRRERAAAKPVQDQGVQDELLRVIVRSTGVYRISGEDLEQAGVRLQEVQPGRLRMLYGGGRILGRSLVVSPGLLPEEIPIIVEDGGDGRFDASDYLLFYGEAAERWRYDTGSQSYLFLQNPYTNDNVYWLAVTGEQDGLRAASRSGAVTDTEARRSDRYRERLHQEDEQSILLQLVGINSGYDWYWEGFQGNARNFSFVIRDAVAEPVDVRTRFWGWTNGEHQFDFKWNSEPIGSHALSGPNAKVIELSAVAGATEGLNQLGIFHRDSELTRLDWIELEYSRRLAARSGELSFDWADAVRTDDGTTHRGVAAFELTGFAGERPRVLDVAQGLAEIVDFTHDPVAGTLEFQDEHDDSDRPPLYVAATPSRWRRPVRISRDAPSHLRAEGNGAEYIIITHSDFSSAAERLAAWRARDDRFGEPMATAVVDVQDVYDEFSGGMVDPMAIRSFVRYAVFHWRPAPFFILLMGDGTYDYKNNSGTSHTNWMPAFQDRISMYDEWYVRITGEDALPDLAIGRLPVQTASEADAVVDKLISYDREPEGGPWRARSLLIADDLANPQNPEEYGIFFLYDAEIMAYRLLPQDLDLVKLYLAQYPLEGRIKPRARDAFIDRFNEGALLVTYLGHGNPETLAHEQMFVLSRDFAAIDNGRRWPFMYTAASQVGVFDDPTRQSMPEVLFSSPDRGVIGFISATRVGYHTSNVALANEFCSLMFQSEERHVPVGMALAVAKQVVDASARDRINIQRYSLVGDPAMRLARPRLQVEVSIPDTFRALEEVQLRGRILDEEGRHREEYTGTARIQVFDSASDKYLDGISYVRPGAPIFRCLARVEGGHLQALFRVPKDVTYRSWKGRASVYVWPESTDPGAADRSAFGSVSGLSLAGTDEGVVPDETGPEISFGFAGQNDFRNGDFVLAHPTMETVIADESGINITGETGHGIVLHVDGTPTEVTESYTNRDGDYRSGILEHDMGSLEPGLHTISLKAWDSFNNSSRAEAEIRVPEEGAQILSGVLFYPNPMGEGAGSFTYTLTAPASEVLIRVYAVSGRLVKEIVGDHHMGFNQVAWNPPGDLANGTYLYRVSADLENGGRVQQSDTIQLVK